MPHRNHATAHSCGQEGSATQNREPAVAKLVGEELSVTILVHREPMGPTAPRLVRYVAVNGLGPCFGVVYYGKRRMCLVLFSMMEMSFVMVLMMEMSLVLTTWLQCQNQGNCHPVTGNCHCPMGWTVSCNIEIKPLLLYECRALWVDLFLHKCTCLSFLCARLSVCRARCVQTPALPALTTSTAGFHLSVLFVSTIIGKSFHWLACTLFVCLEALFELHSGNGAIATTGHIATMSTDSVTVSLAIKGRRWSKK